MVSSFLFYSAAIGFFVGIFARSVGTFGAAFIVAVCVVACGLVLLWYKKRSGNGAYLLLGLCLFLIFFACGSFRFLIAYQDEHTSSFEQSVDTKVTLEGIVAREPEVRASTQHLYVKSEHDLLLITTERYADIAYGDKVNFTGVLQKPEAFITEHGRTFNYPGYLKAQGVEYVVPFAKVVVLSNEHGNYVIHTLLLFKKAFISNIESAITQPHTGLALGLLLGVKQGLGEELENAFRSVGITHIIVLSGYNIMLVVSFVTYMLALFLPVKGRIVVGIIAVVLFACLVGFSATVVRASIMAALALIAQATGRTYAVIRALVCTGIIMLVLNPYLLAFDVGFQLSFIATLGLILVSPHLKLYLGFMPKSFGLREFLTATIAAQIFVTPLLLYQMGQFSIVSVVVNMLVLPIVPVAMLLTFLSGMVGFVSASFAFPLSFAAYYTLAYIIFIAQTFASLPFASVTVQAFPFWVVVGVYLFGAYVLYVLYARTKVIKQTLTGWTIVDEETYTRELTARTKNESKSPPIFFR